MPFPLTPKMHLVPTNVLINANVSTVQLQQLTPHVCDFTFAQTRIIIIPFVVLWDKLSEINQRGHDKLASVSNPDWLRCFDAPMHGHQGWEITWIESQTVTSVWEGGMLYSPFSL